MEQDNIAKIKNKLILTFSLSMLALFIVIASATYFVQKERINNLENSFNSSVERSVTHAFKDIEKEYLNLLIRLSSVAKLGKHLYFKDRDSMYEELKKRYEFLKKENHFVKTMHVHNRDGTSFLRVHKPHVYGDNVSDFRPMLQRIHSENKPLLGYERGVVASLFRVIVPLFYKDEYVGAVEIGFFPEYLLKHIGEISGLEGLLFIKEDKKDLDRSNSDITINSYRLFTNSPLSDVVKSKAINLFKNGEKVSWRGREYILSTYDINDFKNDSKAKMVFFKDITLIETARKHILTLSVITLLIILIIIVILINKNLSLFQKELTNEFQKYTNEIEYKNNYLNILLDLSTNIIITTKGNKLSTVNKAFMKFFKLFTLEQFTDKYTCICDRFEKKEGYLQREMDGLNWIEYVIKNPHHLHKALIIEDNKEYIFLVNCSKIELDKEERYMATLVDITKEVELKNTQLELEQKKAILVAQSKSAMMGDMISMIIHQFKQPLSVLSMIASNQAVTVELGEEITNEKIIKDANICTNQIAYLSTTMDTFRNFLNPETTIVNEEVDNVIESSLNIINKSLINNSIKLSKEYKSDQKIGIIHSELMQVFINLLTNSKDAFKINNTKNRQIWIKTYDKNNNVLIEIEDNAGGIPDDKITKIFDAYFTTKKEHGGTGIGLYIVKVIITEHLNGTIDVQNTNDGTKFIITIPSVI